jgi:hypothetical protein
MCPDDDPPACGLDGCDEDAVPSDDPDCSSVCGPCGDKLDAFQRYEDGEATDDDLLDFGDFIRAQPGYVQQESAGAEAGQDDETTDEDGAARRAALGMTETL